MSDLRISLFGGFQIAHNRWPCELKLTRTVQALLAYLLVQRHRCHPREVLTGLFWGDHCEERARNCLSTTLWRLRRVLEPKGTPKGTYLVTTAVGEVGFNQQSDYWLDVAVFEERVGRILANPINCLGSDSAQALQSCLQLYTGELLEGFYDDWALRERERLRSMYLKGLAYLMRYHAVHGNYEQSLVHGQEILHHDPLREEIHREMMRFHLKNGQRALALRQYESCREILAKELGVPPMEETQTLYNQIVDDAMHPPGHPAPDQDPPAVRHARNQLQRAIQDLEEAQRNLHRAIRLLENALGRHHKDAFCA